MPETTQTPVENAATLLRELAIVLENEGDLVAHAHDASDRTESPEAFQMVSTHVLQAAFAENPVEYLRTAADELELA